MLLHFDVAVTTASLLLISAGESSGHFSGLHRLFRALLGSPRGNPAVAGLDFSLKETLLFTFSLQKWRRLTSDSEEGIQRAPFTLLLLCVLCVFLWHVLCPVFLGPLILLVS